jgi:hypothetical protein
MQLFDDTLHKHKVVMNASLYGHQVLPAQLRPVDQQWWLVHLTARALQHGTAGVGDDRGLPGRHHPSAIPTCTVRQAWWCAVHYQGLQLLRAGAHHQYHRQWVRGQCLGPGQQHQPGAHEQELGCKLAIAGRVGRSGAHLRRDVLRRTNYHHYYRKHLWYRPAWPIPFK